MQCFPSNCPVFILRRGAGVFSLRCQRDVGDAGEVGETRGFFSLFAVCCGLVLTLWWVGSSGKGCEGFGSCQREQVCVVRCTHTAELLQEVVLRVSFVPRKCLYCFEIEKC